MTDVVYADNFDDFLGSNEEPVNAGVKEIFRGTEEETLTWLKEMCKLREGDVNKAFAINLWVMVGDSEKAIHVASYIDPKQRDENRDTRKKKREAIRKLVKDAMEYGMYPPKNEKPGDPGRVLDETTEKIMKLYAS